MHTPFWYKGPGVYLATAVQGRFPTDEFFVAYEQEGHFHVVTRPLEPGGDFHFIDAKDKRIENAKRIPHLTACDWLFSVKTPFHPFKTADLRILLSHWLRGDSYDDATKVFVLESAVPKDEIDFAMCEIFIGWDHMPDFHGHGPAVWPEMTGVREMAVLHRVVYTGRSIALERTARREAAEAMMDLYSVRLDA